ncbi:WXG100 family type VII secretion target [Nocardia sp. NPDC050712]|uniref:WXG100 family type VII secretion target n=1 Tax=Nocardia sp. NPDC050712 TaxID=3155518 RepID=UPI0033FDD94B
MAESTGLGHFEVIPEDLQGLGRAAYQIAAEIRSASASLDTEVQGLMSTWKGAAADSYVAGWNEMHSGAIDVWDTLFALAERLGITAENFRQVDADSSAALSSLDLP